jgi:hypothetical protein
MILGKRVPAALNPQCRRCAAASNQTQLSLTLGIRDFVEKSSYIGIGTVLIVSKHLIGRVLPVPFQMFKSN